MKQFLAIGPKMKQLKKYKKSAGSETEPMLALFQNNDLSLSGEIVSETRPRLLGVVYGI